MEFKKIKESCKFKMDICGNLECGKRRLLISGLGGCLCQEDNCFKLVEYHKNCHDCGRFLKKDRWVRKDHLRKKHGLCADCFSNYDPPEM